MLSKWDNDLFGGGKHLNLFPGRQFILGGMNTTDSKCP